MHQRRTLALIIALALISSVSAVGVGAQRIASEADSWGYMSEQEKIAFLTGFCKGAEGLTGTMRGLGEFDCIPIAMRACGMIHLPERKRVLNWLDFFYSGERYSDVPFWAAVGAFNDQECKENTFTEHLMSLQAQSRCRRLALESGGMFSKERSEKLEACNAM